MAIRRNYAGREKSENENKLLIDVLLKEYDNVNKNINLYLDVLYKITPLWLGIITLTLTFVGLTRMDKSYIIPYIWIALVGTLLIIAFQFVIICHNELALSLGGYKASIEYKINELLQFNILNWELDIVKKTHHKFFSVKVLYSIYAIFPLLLIGTLIDLIWQLGIVFNPVINIAPQISSQGIIIIKVFSLILFALEIIAYILAVQCQRKHKETFEMSIAQYIPKK